MTIVVAPASTTVTAGSTVQFAATVSGTSDTRVLWSTDGGIIQQNGQWQAPQTTGTFHVVAQSVADQSQSTAATVGVTAPPATVGIAINPDHLTFSVGTLPSWTFKSSVTGTSDTSVAWSIQEGSTGGTIDSNGTYRPPSREGVFHVVVASHADGSKSASALITITQNPQDMIDHGGLVIGTSRTFALWWGDSTAFASDARPSLESFLKGLNGSSYLAIPNQYLRGSSASTSFAGALVDVSAPTSDATYAGAVADAACRALDANGITARSGDLVLVNTSNVPANMTGCAWHSSGTCHATTILVAYVPNPAGSSCASRTDYCGTGQSLSSIGMVLAASHELMEALTDPLSTAWYANGGAEMVDGCGAPSCVSLTSGTLALPLVYSNAAHNCVAH